MRAADAARAGYAIGWAQATATHRLGLTDRARAGAIAVMRCAEHDWPAGYVVEGAIVRGREEGAWAVIYTRRDALHAKWQHAMRGVLAEVAARVDTAGVAAAVQRAGGPRHESTQPVDPAVQQAGTQAAADALASALDARLRQAWRTTLHDALVEGGAQGRADAIALIAEHQASVAIDWELAFTDGYNALDGLEAMWADADHWAAKQVGDQADQLGAKLARMWRDGADVDDMEQAITDLLGSDNSASALVLDMALGGALSDGAMATYRDAGLAQVEFMTAGDGKVDELCIDAEAGNPYPVDSAPSPPLHPRCRCAIAPWFDPSTPDLSALYDPYTGG